MTMPNAARVMQRCQQLAQITDVPDETTRTFLSPAMRRCNDQVAQWMQQAGMTTRVDNAGNLRGVLNGTQNAQSKRLLIASHLDTVPNAGAYDGPLGVITGIELAEIARSRALPFSIEVIGFSEEEGVRYQPFIGSRAIVGELTEEILQKKDSNSITVRQALTDYGLHPDNLQQDIMRDAIGYLEFHIEQGPVLDLEDRSLAVVTAIAGQSRYALKFIGQANHAGTTPMQYRHDALAACAEWITQVEQEAKSAGLVATVGSLQVSPNASNVVPGTVETTLDIRSSSDSLRTSVASALIAAASACGSTRGVSVEHRSVQQPAVPMDIALTQLLIQAAGSEALQLVSGAGHDAMIVAPHIPAAMLFLRSPGGISHNPAEAVREEDVAAALGVGVRFLDKLAQEISHA